MNKINQLFQTKNHDLLNIFFTSGYPKLSDTQIIIKELNDLKVDLIEVGIPYSDPLADGETIQHTGKIALENGLNLKVLFNQLEAIKNDINTPLILMGYYNQFLQYGAEEFLKSCQKSGVSGLILPDMPLQIYQNKYRDLFNQYDILISFLVSPQTSDERIRLLAENSDSFVYIVSSASTTGSHKEFTPEQINYFKKVKTLIGDKIGLIGFGIYDHKTYEMACQYSNGAIIGSAFLKHLKGNDLKQEIKSFINGIR